MTTVSEKCAEWRHAGGEWSAFDQSSDLIAPLIEQYPTYAVVKNGVCYAASCVFVQARLALVPKKHDDVFNLVASSNMRTVIGDKQRKFTINKNPETRFRLAGLTATRRFGEVDRPPELSGRENLFLEIENPGVYIFQAFGTDHKGHALAFDTRDLANVFFFDANCGLFSNRSFGYFKDWYRRFWEAKHPDGTTYKRSFGRGGRWLVSYS